MQGILEEELRSPAPVQRKPNNSFKRAQQEEEEEDSDSEGSPPRPHPARPSKQSRREDEAFDNFEAEVARAYNGLESVARLLFEAPEQETAKKDALSAISDSKLKVLREVMKQTKEGAKLSTGLR